MEQYNEPDHCMLFPRRERYGESVAPRLSNKHVGEGRLKVRRVTGLLIFLQSDAVLARLLYCV